MKRLGIFLIGMLIWWGCSDDSDDPLSDGYAKINVVTGLDLFDMNGNSNGTWEKPNDKPGPLRLFPIPTGDALTVSSQSLLTDLWIVPASCEKDSSNRNISELSLDIEFELNEIEMNKINSLQIENFNNSVSLNLTGSTVGFYRLFARTSTGDFFWQNIYYDPALVPLLGNGPLDAACN